LKNRHNTFLPMSALNAKRLPEKDCLMKTDRDQDDAYNDYDETEYDNDDSTLEETDAALVDDADDDAAPLDSTDVYETEADAVEVNENNAGDWDDFQFDSPELAAYASYAAYADEMERSDTADDVDDIETEDTGETLVAASISEYADDQETSESEFQPDQLVFDPSLDIDAALAAVGALPDLMAERDAAYDIERQRQQDVERTAEERERWRQGYRFARPPQMRLQRGQPASVIPALILIAVGAYLTFALTLSQTPPAPGLVALLVCGAIGITLLSYWLNARRWARGALFGGLILIFFGLVFYGVTTPSIASALPAGLVSDSGWRLFLGAVFAALLLSGLLARPVSIGLAVLGMGGLLGIALGLLIDSGALSSLNLNLELLLNEGWKIVLPLLLVLLVIGLFQRLRQRRQVPEAELPAA
jgi:hypothetical protein